MQRWKLIADTAQLKDGAVGEAKNDILIPDNGFASFAHPKLKFNFTVDLVFRKPFNTSNTEDQLYMGSRLMEEFDLPAKLASRPNPSINYTDVNFYNYRTKVATKTEYGTGSVSFHDDSDGKVHTIYEAYLRKMSPISANITDRTAWEANPESAPFGKLSSLGAMEDAAGLIRSISVYHHYILKGRTRRTQYTYINPKIQTFEPDEVNMSESSTSSITLTFVYDGFTVQHEYLDETEVG